MDGIYTRTLLSQNAVRPRKTPTERQEPSAPMMCETAWVCSAAGRCCSNSLSGGGTIGHGFFWRRARGRDTFEGQTLAVVMKELRWKGNDSAVMKALHTASGIGVASLVEIHHIADIHLHAFS